MSKYNFKRIFLLALLCIGIVAGPISGSAYAAETHWGRLVSQGYFSGTSYSWGYNPGSWPDNGYVLPPVYSGVAIPSSVTTNINADKLFNFLQSTYNGSDQSVSQAAMVSFIVHTMLGVDGANAARTVSSAEWTDLSDRLHSSDITISVESHSTNRNTYHQTTSKKVNGKVDRTKDASDVGWATSGQSGRAVVIKNKATNANLYALFVSCANPDGNLNGGLPPATPPPPPAHYYLTPTVKSVNPSSAAESGTAITVTPNVNNSGNKNSDAAPWQVSRFYLPSGQTVPVASSDSTKKPVDYYGNGLVSLGGDAGGIFAPGDTNPGTATDTVGDQAVGTQVCYAVSVQNYTDDPATTNWRHSAPTCIKIGKRPKVQVWGGDLISAGAVNASTANKVIGSSTYTFGSWIEYGIFAISNITGAASGSAYAGAGLAGANNCNESKLSFANSTVLGACLSGTAIGNYANSPSIPNVGASFTVTGSTPQIGSGDLSGSSSSGVFTSNGVTLSGGGIQKGRWVVINAPAANITIDGNITYNPSAMHSLSDIPQVIIIANNINITAKVTQIDAWLIAKGSINTCSDVTGNLSSALCANQLTVNGPVMAGTLYLRRTAGSGTGAAHSGDPAEVFNLRPDAYMWASLRAVRDGSQIRTVYTTEMPPRL